MIQLSKYVTQRQCEVIQELLLKDGALRLYSGTQPEISTRTDGRIVECKIVEVTIDGATLTIKYDAGTAVKDGTASYLRLVSGNIPVLSADIPDSMMLKRDEISGKMMPDREIKVGTIVDAGEIKHTVFK